MPLVAHLPGGRRHAAEERFVSLMDLPAVFLIWQASLHDVRTSAAAWPRSAAATRWTTGGDHILAEFHGHHFPYPQRMICTHTSQAGHQPAGRERTLRSGQRPARVDQPDRQPGLR
ncbi:MAG: hypothetical protein R3A10_10595 [Caldilineaceae bacterium]